MPIVCRELCRSSPIMFKEEIPIMAKSYADLMNEISADELYNRLLAHGLFADKLPPILSSVDFYNYCQKNTTSFSDSWKQYIYYESLRNINVPRPLGIPNPMAYQRLCRCLSDNWGNLQQHFEQQTVSQDYKISRIHIRKQGNSDAIFSMSYSNWRVDGSPEPDLLIGKRYIVKADISTCFLSIYTHSIPWALVGKAFAKEHSAKQYSQDWYNQIDHYTQNCKNGETHGLLIGPHASNLLSEIILTVVDRKLYDNGWRYIRNIDDYTCYVESVEAGQKFLMDLGNELRQFDLSINFKKTEIQELPVAAVEQWVRKINSVSAIQRDGKMDFIAVRAYLDLAIELMQKNKDNSAVLNYAIKVLSGHKLTPNARDYFIKTVFHLSLLYPYLIPLLEKNVFIPFDVEPQKISSFSQKVFRVGCNSQNYEAICYAIYFSLKYNFDIDSITANTAISSDSCLFKLLAFLYFTVHKNKGERKALKDHAKTLSSNEDDFNRNWLFVYEELSQSDLKGEWKPMKKSGVSFVKMPTTKSTT